MRGWIYFIAGGAIGAAASAVVNYLFAPAPETRFDETYQSRLDWALEAGEKAADAREAALRAQFEAAKQPRPRTPDLPPEMPPDFESAAPGEFAPGFEGNFDTDAWQSASSVPSRDASSFDESSFGESSKEESSFDEPSDDSRADSRQARRRRRR